MSTPLEPCLECQELHQPTEARGERCPRCHNRHQARVYRKGYYSDVVKKSAEKLERHRQHAREGMRRIYATEEYRAKRRKGEPCES